MSRVVEHFDRNPELALLGGTNRSESGEFLNGRWTSRSCAIDEKTVWTTLQGYIMWVRTDAAREVGGWDPAIGPGTLWGSSEEPDFGLRLLRRGYKGFYDVDLIVRHPDKRLSAAANVRAFEYGTGMGRVLRLHSAAHTVTATFLIRPLGGLVWSLARGRRANAIYYWRTWHGRVWGYFAPKEWGDARK